MADVFTNAAIAVLDALLSDLAPLLGAVQCTVRTLSFDFWQSWDAAETERVSWFNDPGIRLDALMDEKGIVLDSEARAKLVTAIEYTIEKMDDKVDTHLMETFEVRCKGPGTREAFYYTDHGDIQLIILYYLCRVSLAASLLADAVSLKFTAGAKCGTSLALRRWHHPLMQLQSFLQLAATMALS